MLWRDTDKKKGKLVRSFWFFWFFDGVTSKVYNRNNSIHAILLSLFLHLSFLAFPGLKFMTIRFVSTDQEKNSGGVKENGSSDRSRRLTFSNVHSMEDEMEKNGREGKYTLLLFLLSLESQNGKQSTRNTGKGKRDKTRSYSRTMWLNKDTTDARKNSKNKTVLLRFQSRRQSRIAKLFSGHQKFIRNGREGRNRKYYIHSKFIHFVWLVSFPVLVLDFEGGRKEDRMKEKWVNKTVKLFVSPKTIEKQRWGNKRKETE